MMTGFFAEAEELHGLLLRLIAVDFTYAEEQPGAGPALSAEASRMADVLVGAMVVERVGKQQNSL